MMNINKYNTKKTHKFAPRSITATKVWCHSACFLETLLAMAVDDVLYMMMCFRCCAALYCVACLPLMSDVAVSM